ncbi:DUF177 domain-containing protein [bacterium]|nr:DUF177 domain-containing protein [bacterium]
MKLKDFDIDFIKFKNEVYTFTYELDDTFFKLKEHSLYDRCDINVTCEATKNESTIQLDFHLKGNILANCERCLDEIHIPIDSKFTRVLKLTSDSEKVDDENYLSIHNQVISVYDMIYEHIVLSMPSRLICANALEDKKCTINIEDDSEPSIDPRWEALKKLK